MTLPEGAAGYAVMVFACVFGHEIWRWLGLWLARDLSVDSPVFAWVDQVATALVAGLVMRLMVFPLGELADVALAIRLGALATGIAVYLASARNLSLGIAAGAGAIALAELAAAGLT